MDSTKQTAAGAQYCNGLARMHLIFIHKVWWLEKMRLANLQAMRVSLYAVTKVKRVGSFYCRQEVCDGF
jgi:hypothetical protein